MIAKFVASRDEERLDYVEEKDGKFCVYSEDGRKLGEHDTRAEAEEQLRAIEASKHSRADGADYEDRVDRVEGAQLRPVRRFEDGRIVFEGTLTRSGTFKYRDKKTGREIIEYRPEDEVFKARSMATLEGAWLTNNHPPGLITAKTAKEYSVGAHMGVPRRDGKHLVGSMVVGDDTTSRDMEHGKIDLSCGYKARIDRTPGVTPDGERYDHVQRDIIYNHVAIVYSGRAGDARARMDEAQVANKEKKQMGKIDNKSDAAALRTAATRLAEAEKRADAAEGKLEAAEARADAAEGRADAAEGRVRELSENRLDESEITKRDEEIDALKVRCDEAENALIAVPAMIKAAVQSRVSIEKDATFVMGPEFRMDDVSDRDIMLQVIAKLSGVDIEKERSDDYVRARFDGAVEGFLEGEKALGKIRDDVRQKAKSGEPEHRADARGARAANEKAQKDAWKNPLPSSKLRAV